MKSYSPPRYIELKLNLSPISYPTVAPECSSVSKRAPVIGAAAIYTIVLFP